MCDGKPERIAIQHNECVDDCYAEYVGRTSDGRQFFLTASFGPAIGEHPGSEYLALFLFDADGNLVDAQIDDLGPRTKPYHYKSRAYYDVRLKALGEVTFERIEVKPFTVERFGTTFGLVTHEPEDENDIWVVKMQPGDYMWFFEPWDSGQYEI